MDRKYDLVCFDMDGTLTTVRSSWRWIHDCIGVDSEPNYRAYLNGEIDEYEFMRRDIGLWTAVKPDIKLGDLAHMFQSMPLMEGIQETVAALEESGIHCVIVSGGIDIAAKMLQNEFGFEDAVADSIEVNPDGTFTGYGIENVDLRDKGAWVRKFQERYDVTKERTVSVGNSFTDVPMFRESGLSIAVNCDEYTAQNADVVLETHNIADILDYILPEDADRTPDPKYPGFTRRRSP